MIEVCINGEKKRVGEGMTVGQLLDELKVREQVLLVDQNRELLKKDQFNDAAIEDGDVLELVRLTGGG